MEPSLLLKLDYCLCIYVYISRLKLLQPNSSASKRSALVAIILPHAKNQLSVPGSFLK